MDYITSNKKKISVNIFLGLILVFLPLMFLADGVSKSLSLTGGVFSRVSLIIRFLFEVIVILYLIRKIKYNVLFYFVCIILLLVFFIVGQVTIGNLGNIQENFVTFNKYIYLFLVYLFFMDTLHLNKEKSSVVFNTLQFLFIVNIIFVLLGFIFNISLFESYYGKDYRFGYNGVFSAPNESSFIFISMVSFFYYRAIYENYSKILLFLALISTLITGMKAVYLFLLMLLVFHVFSNLRKKYIILLVLIGGLLLRYLIEYFQSAEFQSLIGLFTRLYKEKGLWHMLLTGRDDLLFNESPLVLEQWSFINVIVGGVNIKNYLIEMDFFDLFLFFGAMGSAVYLFMFFKFFINGLLKQPFFKFFIFSILMLAFFGGHFLYSPSAAIYFSLVILYFRSKKNENIKNESTEFSE